MTNVNIEALREEVAAKQAANAKAVQEAAEVARLEATLKLEGSEELFQAKVRLAVTAGVTQRLQTLVDECSAIVASMPIQNPKTRTERVWAGNHRYGYGNQVDLMYQLATGIMFSCQEHKQLLLAHTGLDLEMLEQFVESFGTPQYYSRNHHMIIEAKPHNMVMVKATLSVMQSELGVVVDDSKVTKDNFEYEFVRAENASIEALRQAEEAIQEADFEL